MNIIELNIWLTERADQWSNYRELNKQDTDWPEYYLGLKDLDKQKSFTISSCDLIYDNPLRVYIQENMELYNCEGGTGFCNFTKK